MSDSLPEVLRASHLVAGAAGNLHARWWRKVKSSLPLVMEEALRVAVEVSRVCRVEFHRARHESDASREVVVRDDKGEASLSGYCEIGVHGVLLNGKERRQKERHGDISECLSEVM
jgi:hypothetical protein